MLTMSLLNTLCLMCCCFFFKQKTAYEMRISDWSSDVCSSGLQQPASLLHLGVEPVDEGADARLRGGRLRGGRPRPRRRQLPSSFFLRSSGPPEPSPPSDRKRVV